MDKKRSLWEYVFLYFQYMKLVIQSRMQYKIDTLMLSFAVLVRESVTVITLYLMLQKFSSVKGWDIHQLLFMYSFVFLTYSLSVLIFTGIRDFESLVHRGEFDMYLTKPLGTMFQVISAKSDIMASLGHGALGIILFVYSASAIHLKLSFYHGLVLLLTILGGILIHAALLIIPSTFTFWTVRSREVKMLMFNQMRGFIVYPIPIYPKVLQVILTFVFPFAFVSYFPAQIFIGEVSVWGYLTPVVGVGFFLLSLAFWNFGVRRYSSSGN
ncbi:ABC transporter permease [Paenibacillus wynnii]|uniref:ABC transporter permease n=1 Tax=Paenibacillus wynnii TaxID=268407 RepID=A0A098MDV5_9BACL|nr:ABC-2 family transporter protein [Paenibacillus wynnii]KGE19742.1 hypothetical protein PWYN_10625 [Paenibacillus wynnii]